MIYERPSPAEEYAQVAEVAKQYLLHLAAQDYAAANTLYKVPSDATCSPQGIDLIRRSATKPSAIYERAAACVDALHIAVVQEHAIVSLHEIEPDFMLWLVRDGDAWFVDGRAQTGEAEAFIR